MCVLTWLNDWFSSIQLLDRRSDLMEKADDRRKLLEDSYKYQQFDRDADEVEGWIREKLGKTQDESYKVGAPG